MTLPISIDEELLELIDKMVRYGIARSRSHAINILIERGLREVREEIEFWNSIYRDVEELERQGYVIRHGYLSRILEEVRSE